MEQVSLTAQIKSLQVQLDILKAQAKNLDSAESKPRYFGDLYGVLAGQSDTSEEEINAVLYRID